MLQRPESPSHGLTRTRRIAAAAFGCLLVSIVGVSVLAQPPVGGSQTRRSVTSDWSPGDAVIVADGQASLIRNTTIAAPLGGVLTEIVIGEGDDVFPGMLLARFDDDEASAEVTAARASFEAASIESRNDIDARYAERSREVHLRELTQSEQANQEYSGAISGTEIERLRMVVDQSTLAIEQAMHEQAVAEARATEKQAAMQVAATRLSKHRLKSPVDGLVAEINVQKGQWVEQGKPLLRVISLDPIRVECFVDGRVHGDELVGNAVRFEPETAAEGNADDETPQFLVGEVTFVSPELHPVTGQARLWATLANPDRIVRAGMRGQLLVGPAQKRHVEELPAEELPMPSGETESPHSPVDSTRHFE